MSSAVSVTRSPKSLAPLRSRSVSPASAPVPARLTCTTGCASSVRPPLATGVVTGPTSSSSVITGAAGRVVSTM